MLLTVLGGLAEFERSLIRARTSEVSVLYRLLRLTTVVNVSHVDLKIDRAMKTPRSLAGETEVSLTRAMLKLLVQRRCPWANNRYTQAEMIAWCESWIKIYDRLPKAEG